jgi:hypothetical protein
MRANKYARMARARSSGHNLARTLFRTGKEKPVTGSPGALSLEGNMVGDEAPGAY